MNFAYTWRKRFNPLIEHWAHLSLLIVRLWLGQEFLYAAYQKLQGGWAAPEWFADLAFPLPFSLLPPSFNWGMVGITELIFGLALVLGLWTRLSALILLIVTYVAVYSVHFDLGWSGWNQIETDDGLGFKVPLMIATMLLVVLGHGAGRWSLDRRMTRTSLE